MQRKEFLAVWKEVREAQLKDIYKGDPHGAACIAASLVEVDNEGRNLWVRFRHTFMGMTQEEFKTWIETSTTVSARP